uniref:Non-haem dioxygenase N-terminal domain-containing protein n=2 Tax=Opuntia streptacantha TaxID=393608 RepID=A0A7C9E7X6_OPUST
MAIISPQLVQKQGKDKEQESRDPIPLDFRAPPPSPIASSRRSSSVTNDEVLTEFLEHTLRVPDLILPDRIFPRQKALQDIPTVDFPALLNSPEYGSASKIQDSLTQVGCFQLIHHGISPDLLESVINGATRIFRVPLKQKRTLVRSPEMPFGFEEVSGEQEEILSEMSEEFVWGRSSDFKLKMEGIWPTDYSNFSEKMEKLAMAVEKISKEIMLVLHENFLNIPNYEEGNIIAKGQQSKASRCHIFKHPYDAAVDQCIKALRYDVIRMMIRGSDYSHALSIHVCEGSSEFHVYSKKGWVSFTPSPNALIVTAGDQVQAWSGGQYKHVIGRPIYTSKYEGCVSMAFLYSPSPTSNIQFHQEKKARIITLREQALFALFFTIGCQFLLLIYNKL